MSNEYIRKLEELSVKWPIGCRVCHKEYRWPGRIIGNQGLTIGHNESPALEVHFYFADPPAIKYEMVLPVEIERADDRPKHPVVDYFSNRRIDDKEEPKGDN